MKLGGSCLLSMTDVDGLECNLIDNCENAQFIFACENEMLACEVACDTMWPVNLQLFMICTRHSGSMVMCLCSTEHEIMVLVPRHGDGIPFAREGQGAIKTR